MDSFSELITGQAGHEVTSYTQVIDEKGEVKGYEWALSDTSAAPKKTHRNLQEWSFWENESKDSTQETKKGVSVVAWHDMPSLWEMNHTLSKSWMLLGFLMHVRFFVWRSVHVSSFFSGVHMFSSEPGYCLMPATSRCSKGPCLIFVSILLVFRFSEILWLTTKMSPFMLEKRAKLNIVCLYRLCWIKIPGDHHFLATPRKFYRPGLGFIVYINDMFATCLTKMKPAGLEAWRTFQQRPLHIMAGPNKNIENKSTRVFCLKKCRKRAPLQHASTSHQSLVVELNTFPPQQS